MGSSEVAELVSLAGATAVVTGGGGGIGGGTSRLLAAAGATVVLNDLDAELAAVAVADIEAGGGSAIAVVGDIRDADVVERLALQLDRWITSRGVQLSIDRATGFPIRSPGAEIELRKKER